MVRESMEQPVTALSAPTPASAERAFDSPAALPRTAAMDPQLESFESKSETQFAKRLARHLAVVELALFSADDLVGFMALAGN